MVDLENKPQDFLDLYALANPLPEARAKVPLLEVLDPTQSPEPMLLTESLVVADYVAEQYGSNSLLAPLAKDRATSRLFTELCGSSFSYFPLLRAKNNDEYESSLETLKQGLVQANAFLQHYQSGPFLLGTRFSLAECNAAPFVQRACTILPKCTKTGVDPMNLCDELGLVHLKLWMQAVLARPSVVATGVPPDEMIQRTQKMLERFASMEKKS